MTDDRFKRLIAVLIAVVTTLIAIVTFLQSDASNRDERANRDTKRYSLEAFGRQVSGDAQVNFDYNSAYQGWYELDLLAAAASNVGDDDAARRYQTLRDRMTSLSPLLAAPYFDPATGQANVAQYESDVYVVDTTALYERFSAAHIVKDAWDYKANTYIVHLTLLAVSLFLFGLSTTIPGNTTRWIFAGSGVGISAIAVVWVLSVFATPVKDLRDCATSDGTLAIDAYAQGVGLAYQTKHAEAIARFDQALSCEPDYANALAARGDSNLSLGNFEAAAADYEKARAAGDASANVAGQLAWTYHLLGRFDDAVNMNRVALATSPDELWIQFDLALSLLAGGQVDAAKAEYAQGMDLAARQVAEAKAAGQEPSSFLWWALDDAAMGVDELIETVEFQQGPPPPDTIADPEAVMAAGEELVTQIKSLAVALEFTGQPPAGQLTATISPFVFAAPLTDDAGNVVDYEESDEFLFGTDSVSVFFDYDGMADGQDVLFKVYVNGEEDPSWRIVEPWSLGASGSAEKPISLAYSNVSILQPGFYEVEMYVNSRLAQRGAFTVLEEGQ